jgi:hypothetical protein
MRTFLDMADRRLGEMAEEKRQIESNMEELRQLREETAQSLMA